MGAAVSVGSEEGQSQFLYEARAYFSNVTLLRALWVAVDKKHRGVITLEQLRAFLNSPQRDTCVALIQSPLNTPFLASKSCLREAYFTCTHREGHDLSSAELFENEFPLYIRHLFLYMQLYAVLGGAVRHEDVISFANFCLIQEDLYDASDAAYVMSRSAYNSLHEDGEELTYGRYVEHKVVTALQPLGHSVDTAVKEVDRFFKTQQSRRLPIGHTPSTPEKAANVHPVINITWYHVADAKEWLDNMKQVDSIIFGSILDHVYGSITVLWHDDDGSKYADFVTEQMKEGGYFREAIEDGMIAAPFDSYAMTQQETLYAETSVRPHDMLYFVAVAGEDKGAIDFLRKEQDEERGLLQSCFGQLISEYGVGMLHQYQQEWTGNLPSYGSVLHELAGRVLASYEDGRWLE